MPLEIVPFDRDMIPQAGELLAHRHARDRIDLPELPARFEDPAVASIAIEAALKRNEASGVGAMSNGQLVGYMIGDLQFSDAWGRSAWIRTAGCAIAPEVNPELIYEMYAVLGQRWLFTYGCFQHVVLTPIRDAELIHTWFMLSFGVQQVHALQAVENVDLTALSPLTDIEIRQATPEDRDAMAEMSDSIWRHQIQAPIWAGMPPEEVIEAKLGWGGLTSEPDTAVWLAFQQGKVVASQGWYAVETADDNLMLPERCARMTVAGTRESVRGRGIQRIISQHRMQWLHENGYQYCETDWRSTNKVASQTWLRHGFRPVLYRLVRQIDPRVLWSRGLE